MIESDVYETVNRGREERCLGHFYIFKLFRNRNNVCRSKSMIWIDTDVGKSRVPIVHVFV
jgi:hypothetical protein